MLKRSSFREPAWKPWTLRLCGGNGETGLSGRKAGSTLIIPTIKAVNLGNNPAIEARSRSGDAAWFHIDDADGDGNALYVHSIGLGAGVYANVQAGAVGIRAKTIGTEEAGVFEISNASNAKSALLAKTTGVGPALQAIAGTGLAGDFQGTVQMTGLNLPTGAAVGKVLTSDAFGRGTWQDSLTAGTSWSLTGNSGTDPDSNFLGTTDNQALEFRVNSERALRIEPGSATFYGWSPNIVGGWSGNTVALGAGGCFIGGGGADAQPPGDPTPRPNTITDSYSVVAGGIGNRAGNASGSLNDAWFSTVGGGFDNEAANKAATIAGGYHNRASGDVATVGGGKDNTASGCCATVAGGFNNTATNNGAFVGGGLSNRAAGLYSTVAGGSGSETQGDRSFAAGTQTWSIYNCSFVWGDSTTVYPDYFGSTAANQFLVKATGGVGINTNAPTATLDVNGTAQMTGFRLTTGAAAAKVLTSDAFGVGTWQDATGLSLPYSGNVASAGHFRIAYPNNTSPAILAETDGSGPAIRATASSGIAAEFQGTVQTTSFRMSSGAMSGKVLTSDEWGNGTWQTP